MACAAVIAVTLSESTRIIFGRPTPIALDRRQSGERLDDRVVDALE